MGAFIGAIGGLLMIILIVVLFLKLLSDYIGNGIQDFVNKNAKFILAVLLLGVFQLMIAALIISFAYGNVSVFQLEQIWHVNPVESDLIFLEHFSFAELFSQGRFPLFYLLAHFLSILLFHQVEATALYLGLISGIITFVSLKTILERGDNIESSKAKQLVCLAICIPGSFYLFLPSAYSFGIALICLFYCVWNKGKGNIILSGLLSLLCCITHFWGVITLTTLVMSTFLKNDLKEQREKRTYLITLISFIILCACSVFITNNELCEYVIPCEIMAILLYKIIPKTMSYGMQVLFEVMMVSTSGLWLMNSLGIIR